MIKTAFDNLYTELSISINYKKNKVSKIILNNIKNNTCKSFKADEFELALSEFFTDIKSNVLQIITTDDMYDKIVEEAFDLCYL